MLNHSVFGMDTVVVGLVVTLVTTYRIKHFPPSIVAMIMGTCISPFLGKDFGFSAEVFLYMMLPPIVLRSGLEFKWSQSRRTWKTALLLAIFGTIISATYVTLGCVIQGRISELQCMRLGSVLSSTDPVAVLSTLNNYAVPEKLKNVLENEALTNDGVAAMLTHTITSKWSASDAAINFFVGIMTTLSLGSICGYCSASFTNPLSTVGIALATYATCELMDGSGILAMFIFGITHRWRTTADGLKSIVFPIADLADIYCVFALGTEARHIADVDYTFAIIIVLSCVVGRIIHVFLLGKLSCQNWNTSHLCFMALCGTRGALSYALSRSTQNDRKDTVIETTVLFVVLSTTAMTTFTGLIVRALF